MQLKQIGVGTRAEKQVPGTLQCLLLPINVYAYFLYLE